MVRFLHTADWQLGMTRYFLEGEAQARFSQARIDVIRRMGEIAVEERCNFIVVCGDVFESNQVEREVVIRALEAMGETPHITFYLLPGNHDPLDASSVYRSPTFTKKRPGNVVVLEGSEPLEVAPGVEMIPAPWFGKDPRADLVNNACDGLDPTDAIRIVIGHGQLDTLFPSRHEPGRVELSALEQKLAARLVHYVALGDRHSKTEAGHSGRVWYSGTPEPCAFREVDPGHVLVVTIGADWVNVEERPVGAWRFLSEEWDIRGDADLDALSGWLSDLRPKERTIVRLSLVGQVSVAQKARLNDILEDHLDPLAALDCEDGGLVVVPDKLDIEEFGLSGFARIALEDLIGLVNTEEHGAVACDALTLLYQMVEQTR